MRKLGIRLARFLLTRGNLTLEESNLLITSVLDVLGALPFTDVISVDDEGVLSVNGRSLALEEMKKLRDAAESALNNSALTLVRDQVAYIAVTTGVHKADSIAQTFFCRTAIWWGQQENKLLHLLAQRTQEPTL